MLDTTQMYIHQQTKDILWRDVNYTRRNSIDVIVPTMIKGTKVWRCKMKGASFSETRSLQWIENVFKKDFQDMYEKLLDDSYLDKEIKCPSEKQNSGMTISRKTK